MRTALFTGAGASRAIGYPLTSEFLPRIRDEIADGALFADTNGKPHDAADRRELLGFLCELLAGFRRAPTENLPLVTDVFSMVEYAIAAGESLLVGGDKTLRRFRDLLKQAIADILVGDFITPWNRNNAEHRAQRKSLERFQAWTLHQGESLGIVTTNYDVGLELIVGIAKSRSCGRLKAAGHAPTACHSRPIYWASYATASSPWNSTHDSASSWRSWLILPADSPNFRAAAPVVSPLASSLAIPKATYGCGPVASSMSCAERASSRGPLPRARARAVTSNGRNSDWDRLAFNSRTESICICVLQILGTFDLQTIETRARLRTRSPNWMAASRSIVPVKCG
jgi:hypothetical protein